MLHACQGRRRQQPAPVTFWSSSSQKKKRPPSTIDSTKQASTFVDAVKLRQNGLTLEEIGNEIGATRLAVFRYFIRDVDKDTRLRLALPTAAEEYALKWKPLVPGSYASTSSKTLPSCNRSSRLQQ
jgi:hypothetical protein